MSDDNIFRSRWAGCVGIFAPTKDLTSEKNEQIHYQKHAKMGYEWEIDLNIKQYREFAKEHLNTINQDCVLEFCQLEDKAVVKYNLATGDLGIATREGGRIKTFFRPNDFNYIQRKIIYGLWSDPLAEYGTCETIDADNFDDDPEKNFLFNKLMVLGAELPVLAEKLFIIFSQDYEIDGVLLYNLIGSLGEYRYLISELGQRYMSDDQENQVHEIRNILSRGLTVLEVLEKSDISLINMAISELIEEVVELQEKIWIEGFFKIENEDDLEMLLVSRDALGFFLQEIKIMQMRYRFLGIDLNTISYRIKKSDIYLRKSLYECIRHFDYKNKILITPDNFFWRKV